MSPGTIYLMGVHLANTVVLSGSAAVATITVTTCCYNLLRVCTLLVVFECLTEWTCPDIWLSLKFTTGDCWCTY